MKKLEVHVHPGLKTKGRDFTFSVKKAIAYVVVGICAILGFVMFSPVQILENLSNGNLIDVYHQNSVIKKEIKKKREKKKKNKKKKKKKKNINKDKKKDKNKKEKRNKKNKRTKELENKKKKKKKQKK